MEIPGLTTELFFAITGYFLYSEDLGKVQSRIWKSIKKVIPIMIFLQLLYLPTGTAGLEVAYSALQLGLYGGCEL